MGTAYYIAGRRFYRRSNISLDAQERRSLEQSGRVTLLRPVQWPLPDRAPDLSRAHVDPGGTDIWGPGPYLKVPNHGEGQDYELVHRVFCPWGYPPDRLRMARTSHYLRLVAVDLLRSETGPWHWKLTLEPWLPTVNVSVATL